MVGALILAKQMRLALLTIKYLAKKKQTHLESAL